MEILRKYLTFLQIIYKISDGQASVNHIFLSVENGVKKVKNDNRNIADMWSYESVRLLTKSCSRWRELQVL